MDLLVGVGLLRCSGVGILRPCPDIVRDAADEELPQLTVDRLDESVYLQSEGGLSIAGMYIQSRQHLTRTCMSFLPAHVS